MPSSAAGRVCRSLGFVLLIFSTTALCAEYKILYYSGGIDGSGPNLGPYNTKLAAAQAYVDQAAFCAEGNYTRNTGYPSCPPGPFYAFCGTDVNPPHGIYPLGEPIGNVDAIHFNWAWHQDTGWSVSASACGPIAGLYLRRFAEDCEAYGTCSPRPDKDPACPADGNPVSVFTGAKIERALDYSDAAAGLVFERFYSSTQAQEGALLGPNWRSFLDMRVVVGSTTALLSRPDGRVVTFGLTSGVWQPESDVNTTLVSVGTFGDPDFAGWRWSDEENTEYVFDASGKPQRFTLKDGRSWAITYSDSTTPQATAPGPGFPITLSGPFGRTVQLRYNSRGQLSQLIDPTNQAIVYQYTDVSSGSAVLYSALATVTSQNGDKVTYLYNEPAYAVAQPPWPLLTGIIDGGGKRFATFTYDSQYRAVSTEHGGGVSKYSFDYSVVSHVATTNPSSGTTTRTFQTVLGVGKTTSASEPCAACGTSAAQTYTHDDNGNPQSMVDFDGNRTDYVYDTARNLETSRTEGLTSTGASTAATKTTSTTWHPNWRLPKTIAQPLKITTFTYNGESGVSCAPDGASTALLCSKEEQATTDATGAAGLSALSNLADGAPRKWSYTYNLSGQVLTVDGPRGDVSDLTSFTYDSMGNLATVTDALGHQTQFTDYDAAGRLKRSVDANGLETLLDYDERGQLLHRQVGRTSDGYEKTTYEYETFGLLRQVTLPDGSYVKYLYDDAHRLVEIQDGFGNHIIYTLDGAGNRTLEQTYDSAGWITKEPSRAHSRLIDTLNRISQETGGTSPSTQITTFGYDANNNKTSVTDPLHRTTVFKYDPLNRLHQIIDPLNGPDAPTSYEYNGQDHLISVKDPTGLSTTYSVNGHGEVTSQSSPDTGITSFKYDEMSNLKEKLDARGVTTKYEYDALNRLSQVTYVGYPAESVAYSYDSCVNGIGRLCSITDHTGMTSYSYDIHGRVVTKMQTVDSIQQSISYGYNGVGQLVSISLPSGHQVTYGYVSKNSRPISIAVDGLLILSGVYYEPFGPNGGWLWGNSQPGAANAHTRIFDLDWRATRLSSDLPASGSQSYFDIRYGWDAQTRISSLTAVVADATSYTSTFEYDALDRLTSASRGADSLGYTYDGVGNRSISTVNGSLTNYSYAPGTHRLSALTGAQQRNFQYDAAGNMTSDGVNTWVYGGANRATQAGPAGVSINALGQRVKKVVGGITRRFMYDESGHLWGEYDNQGQALQETVWLGELPVAVLK